MKKNKDFRRLIKLYLAYHINKTSILVLGIVLFLWILVLFLNTGCPIEKETYAVSPKEYHAYFLEQSLFFLQILDGVIIAFLVGTEISSLALFDPMFVPNVSRIKIVLSKLLANGIILFVFLLFQILFLYLIGTIIFPDFIMHNKDFLLIFYIGLPLIELLLLGEFLSLLLRSYFISILIFILHILSIILLKIDKISTTLSLFIPKINLSVTEFTLSWNGFIYSGICISVLIAIILLFQKKDISE